MWGYQYKQNQNFSAILNQTLIIFTVKVSGNEIRSEVCFSDSFNDSSITFVVFLKLICFILHYSFIARPSDLRGARNPNPRRGAGAFKIVFVSSILWWLDPISWKKHYVKKWSDPPHSTVMNLYPQLWDWECNLGVGEREQSLNVRLVTWSQFCCKKLPLNFVNCLRGFL